MRINKHDRNGTKPLLGKGELGYDDYVAGGDAGRVYVGTGSENIALAEKSEIDSHAGRTDNPHSVTKAQVGLANVDNTSDANKPISTATQNALNAKVDTSTNQTIGGVKTFSSSPIVPTPTTGTQAANKDYVDTKVDKVTSTDNAVVRFDGTTGEVQNSGVIIDDNGNVGIGTSTITPLSGTTKTLNVTSTYDAEVQVKGSGAWLNTYSTNTTVDGFGGWMHYNSAGISKEWVRTTGDGAINIGTNGTDRIKVDAIGNLLLTSGTGALGYGAGVGGTVTQLTSKSTAVTLNKPSGSIVTHNAALAAGASVTFTVNNSSVSSAANDYVGIINQFGNADGSAYRVEVQNVSISSFDIRVTNISASSLSTPLTLLFVVIRGAVS